MAELPANGTNVPNELIVFHHCELSKIERDESEANEVLKAVRARKKKYRKTVQADGLTLKNFDRAREILLANEADVKADFAETGRILIAFKAPIGHQFDMFDEPDRASLQERWRYQGFLAGARGGDISENPHQPGDDGHKAWLDGYKGAQASIAMGLKQSQASNDEYEADDAPSSDTSNVVDLEEVIQDSADELGHVDADEMHVQ